MLLFKYARYSNALRMVPSLWDLLAFIIIITGLVLVVWGTRGMTVPYTGAEGIHLSLDPENLPYYAMRTVLRMSYALILSLLFSFVYASFAAKSVRAERIMIPVLDVLQSVPILGFLSITVTGFMAMFPGNLLGVECAAIFAIFTSQAWNMTFSLYQSFISVPKELTEVATINRMSPWRRYWNLEVPFAVPQLLWNTMMSVSGGWFFVVASEAITVSGETVMLPGIGSYIAMASKAESYTAIGYAILTMLVVIVLYDQLLFKPLFAWSDKFKAELTTDVKRPSSWMLTVIRRARVVGLLNWLVSLLTDSIDSLFQYLRPRKLRLPNTVSKGLIYSAFYYAFIILCVFLLIYYSIQSYSSIFSKLSFDEVQHVTFLTFITMIRVIVLCALASLIWVPIGIMIGLNRPLASRLQPIVQFMAAFPANLFFPIAVVLVLKYHLNHDVWLSPLMILGTQWYILFNVIGGASALPYDFQEVATNLRVKGWAVWKKLYLPGIAPAYVTGLITAVGGSWNASIIAEYVSWGDTTLEAHGVGAYIAEATAAGDQPRILLGVVMLSIFVLVLNRLFWHRFYVYATNRYRLD